MKHLPGLDTLRGCAILLVLMHNFATVDLPTTVVGRLVEDALDFGWVGVQLFFVLSGFLITRILLQTQPASNYYRSFFARRILRIFPLYYGALVAAFILLPLIGVGSAKLSYDRDHQIWLWLYLSNWTQLIDFDSRVFPHFWSLAVEEQFYLLWPFLLNRRSPRWVLGLCVAMAAVSLAVRVVMLRMGAPAESVYTFTVCRMDALALGSAAAAWLQLPGSIERLAAQRRLLNWSAILLFGLGVVVTHGYPRTSPLGQTLGYSWLACVFAMTVLAAASPAEATGITSHISKWSAAPLQTLGKYSYAMYVFHKPLHDWIGRPLLLHLGLLRQPSYVIAIGYTVVGTLATLALASLSYLVFEKHFLALKRWFIADAEHTQRGDQAVRNRRSR